MEDHKTQNQLQHNWVKICEVDLAIFFIIFYLWDWLQYIAQSCEGGSISKLFNRELQIFGIKLRLAAVWDTILFIGIFLSTTVQSKTACI